MAVEQLTASFVKIDDSSSQEPTDTSVYQYIDILKSDISSQENRKSYEVFVTGGTNEATVKSTIYQTIFDQDFTLSTSNALFDITLGLLKEESTDGSGNIFPTINGRDYSYDSAGKIVGFNNELMIREKVNVYRQFAQSLLGSHDEIFYAPHGENSDTGTPIKSALFLCFKRLFTRDNINKGSFNMSISRNSAYLASDSYDHLNDNSKGSQNTNLFVNYANDTVIRDLSTINISDPNGNSNILVSPVSGEVTTLTATIDNVTRNVGLIYYDKGIVVLDTDVLFDTTQTLRGAIDSTSKLGITNQHGPWYALDGATIYQDLYTDSTAADQNDDGGQSNSITISGTTFHQPAGDNDAVVSVNAEPDDQPKFDLDDPAANDFYSSVVDDTEGLALFSGTLKDFISEASLDDILTHFCESRFGETNESSITFQNETVINSKIYYCRAAPSQLNYSTNSTYTDSEGSIIPLVGGKPFAFVTSVGLFDSTGTLVAVAKTSRPIEKNSQTDLTINVRLDY